MVKGSSSENYDFTPTKKDACVIGIEVTRNSVAVSIDDGAFDLVLEGDFSFFNSTERHSFPDEPALLAQSGVSYGIYAPLLTMIGKQVQSLRSCNGVITLQLEDGWLLSAPFNDNYENWELYTPSLKAICCPGGELAIWEKSK